jgi:hypothetical protein
MSSDDGKLFGYTTLGFGLGLYCFVKGFREFRKYRVLADTPEVPIRSMAMGLVEVHGKATGEEQVYSPVSNTPCYFYKVNIEKYVKDSEGRGGWAHQATDTNGVPFYLEDASGKVLVDLQGVEFDLNEYCKREIGGRRGRGFVSRFTGTRKANLALGVGPDDSDLLNYVASVGSGMVVPKRVSSSAPKLVAGEAISGSTGSQSLSEAQRELDLFRLQMRARRGLQKSRGGLGSFFDFLRDASLWRRFAVSGRFRLTEYCILADGWYDLTGTCVENPRPRDMNDRNMLVKGENEPTFLISWRSEQGIEGALRRRAIKYIFGGGILSAICLAIMLSKLGWL